MTIDNETYFALVEERLKAGERVKITLVGSSMQPTLIAGDELELAPLKALPQVGDVVLFRFQGRHLLHRVETIDGDRYTMRGDNCVNREIVGKEEIVARLENVRKHHLLKHWVVRWLGSKGRKQLRPWYFLGLAILMDNYILGLRMDHLLHASVFIPCALFLWNIYGVDCRRWAVWATAVAVGVLTETVQWLLPYRGYDINDMIANFLGVTLGFGIILFLRGVRRRRQCPGRARRGGCR